MYQSKASQLIFILSVTISIELTVISGICSFKYKYDPDENSLNDIIGVRNLKDYIEHLEDFPDDHKKAENEVRAGFVFSLLEIIVRLITVILICTLFKKESYRFLYTGIIAICILFEIIEMALFSASFRLYKDFKEFYLDFIELFGADSSGLGYIFSEIFEDLLDDSKDCKDLLIPCIVISVIAIFLSVFHAILVQVIDKTIEDDLATNDNNRGTTTEQNVVATPGRDDK